MSCVENEHVFYEAIGSNIKTFRKKINLSQAQLAEKTGLSRTSITHIENGNQKSPLHVIVSICATLGIELKDLVPSVSSFCAKKVNKIREVHIGTGNKLVPESIAAVIDKL